MLFSIDLRSTARWIVLLALFSSVIGALALPAKAENVTGWLGDNFFEVVDGPIVYDFWGPLEDFRRDFEALDADHYLAKDTPPNSLLDADLFIFVLENWRAAQDIPYRYAELAPILDMVDLESKSTSRLIDISIDENGSPRPLRFYFISLQKVGDQYNNADCLVSYIYATSLFKDKNAQLSKMGCK